MIIYDGSTFTTTEKFSVMFPSMGQDKERWLKEYSVLVDCIFMALDNGVTAKKKDVAVEG